jgi:hypothetical protein
MLTVEKREYTITIRQEEDLRIVVSGEVSEGPEQAVDFFQILCNSVNEFAEHLTEDLRTAFMVSGVLLGQDREDNYDGEE